MDYQWVDGVDDTAAHRQRKLFHFSTRQKSDSLWNGVVSSKVKLYCQSLSQERQSYDRQWRRQNYLWAKHFDWVLMAGLKCHLHNTTCPPFLLSNIKWKCSSSRFDGDDDDAKSAKSKRRPPSASPTFPIQFSSPRTTKMSRIKSW